MDNRGTGMRARGEKTVGLRCLRALVKDEILEENIQIDRWGERERESPFQNATGEIQRSSERRVGEHVTDKDKNI